MSRDNIIPPTNFGLPSSVYKQLPCKSERALKICLMSRDNLTLAFLVWNIDLLSNINGYDNLAKFLLYE